MSNIFKATVDLDNQRYVDVELDLEGVKESKKITYDDFLSIVNEREKFDADYTVTKLPEHTVSLKLKDNENYDIVVFVPKDKRYVCFLKQTMRVCYPNLIFCFAVRSKRPTNGRCYAVKDGFESIGPETEVYNYPFGNVSPGGGSICFGTIQLPDIEKPYDINQVLEMFFSADTNNHLWVSGQSATLQNIDEIYMKMSEAEKFNNDLLVPAGTLKKIF